MAIEVRYSRSALRRLFVDRQPGRSCPSGETVKSSRPSSSADLLSVSCLLANLPVVLDSTTQNRSSLIMRVHGDRSENYRQHFQRAPQQIETLTRICVDDLLSA